MKEMVTNTDANIRFAQVKYNKFFDKSVRIKTLFKPGDDVFVDWAPAEIQIISDLDVSTTKPTFQSDSVNKLLPKLVGPYTVIHVTVTNLDINDGQGKLKVSIGVCTKEPHPDPPSPAPVTLLAEPGGLAKQLLDIIYTTGTTNRIWITTKP